MAGKSEWHQAMTPGDHWQVKAGIGIWGHAFAAMLGQTKQCPPPPRYQAAWGHTPNHAPVPPGTPPYSALFVDVPSVTPDMPVLDIGLMN